jgi:uncharacterized protein (DUF697 family)
MDESVSTKLKNMLSEAKGEISNLGGVAAFKSGEWFFKMIAKSLKNYFSKADLEYFQKKYPKKDNNFISDKLISVAAQNASLVGALTGAALSADEIATILTFGEGGIGIPANIAIGVSAFLSEAVVLVRIQLKLILELSKIYNVELNPEDPEDVLIIFAYAMGGSVVEAAGKFGMKIGAHMLEDAIKNNISKDVLKTLQKIGTKMGLKILQRSIIKYTLPLASIGIGTGWNYFSTRSVGKIAVKHFKNLARVKNEATTLRSK